MEATTTTNTKGRHKVSCRTGADDRNHFVMAFTPLDTSEHRTVYYIS